MSQTHAEWLRKFIQDCSECQHDVVQLWPEQYDWLNAILAELERPTFEARFARDGKEYYIEGDDAQPAEWWARRLGWTPQPGEVVQVTVRKGGEG